MNPPPNQAETPLPCKRCNGSGVISHEGDAMDCPRCEDGKTSHTCWDDVATGNCVACANQACVNDPGMAAQLLTESLEAIANLLGPNVRESDIILAKSLAPALARFLERK